MFKLVNQLKCGNINLILKLTIMKTNLKIASIVLIISFAMFACEKDELEQINLAEPYNNSAYFYSGDTYYPLDTGLIRTLIFNGAPEGILYFQGWYNQNGNDNDGQQVISRKTSRLTLFFTTYISPGTYDIIPVYDWIQVDLLWSERNLVPAGKCIGYFTVGTDVPTTEYYYKDPVYMSRLNVFTNGQVRVEQEDEIYRIEIIGQDKSNTEVKVYYEGELKSDSVSLYVDPNFAIPQIEDI